MVCDRLVSPRAGPVETRSDEACLCPAWILHSTSSWSPAKGVESVIEWLRAILSMAGASRGLPVPTAERIAADAGLAGSCVSWRRRGLDWSAHARRLPQPSPPVVGDLASDAPFASDAPVTSDAPFASGVSEQSWRQVSVRIASDAPFNYCRIGGGNARLARRVAVLQNVLKADDVHGQKDSW